VKVSVHMKKALSDDLEGAFVFVNVSTVHLELLGRIHDFQWIAAIISGSCPVYALKSPINFRGS
jgi:hypothetical protein